MNNKNYNYILGADELSMMTFESRMKNNYKRLVSLTFDAFQDNLKKSNISVFLEKIKILILNANTDSKYSHLNKYLSKFYKLNIKFLEEYAEDYSALLTLNKVKGDKNIYDTLNYLIFEIMNTFYTLQILEMNYNYVLYSREDQESLLDKMINNYVGLSSNDKSGINYYYVILSNIIDNLTCIDDVKYCILKKLNANIEKEHVRLLIKKINHPVNDKHELEYKYNMSFMYPYINVWDSCYHESRSRVNYTDELVFTIDRASATCLDDAIHVRENSNGTYSLFVHIADTSIIKRNSSLDIEARKRGETLFLPDDTVLMLPSVLCNDDLSILPDNNKMVMTYEFLFDNNFDLVEDYFSVYQSVISSKNKLSYVNADEIINGRVNVRDDLKNSLNICANMANSLRKKNLNALEYRTLENTIDKILGKELKESYYVSSISSIIISEFATLVGRKMADYVSNNGYPFIYRVNDMHRDSKISREINNINEIIEQNKININSNELNDIIKKFRELYCRSSYSSSPEYHNGLGYKCYSHVTSPLRRYSDTYNSYMIDKFIFGNGILNDKEIYKIEAEINRIVPYLNNRSDDYLSFSIEYGRVLEKKRRGV